MPIRSITNAKNERTHFSKNRKTRLVNVNIVKKVKVTTWEELGNFGMHDNMKSKISADLIWSI